jgi:hypothetical protein
MDFNDYPTTQEAKNIPWKPLLIGGGGFVVFVLIVVIVFRVFISGPSTTRDQLLFDQMSDAAQDIQQNCDSSDESENCARINLTDLAQKTGLIAACDDLEDKEKDNCIWLAARESLNPDDCAHIQDVESSNECHDGIWQKLASSSKDMSLCEEMYDDEKALGCKRLLAGPPTVENCEELEYTQDECNFFIVSQEASEKNDGDICMSLDEGLVSSCLEMVVVDDADADGLSREEEVLYGTDAHNPDSDGDGYSDGDEVESGYNPNGEGSLE